MQRRHWGELRGRLMQQGRRITQMMKMSMMILILMVMTVMTIDMDVAIRCQMTTNKKCLHHLAFIFCALRSVAAQPNAWAVGISSHLHWHEGPDRAMIGTGRLEHAEYPEAAIASAMDYNFAWRTSCTKFYLSRSAQGASQLCSPCCIAVCNHSTLSHFEWHLSS